MFLSVSQDILAGKKDSRYNCLVEEVKKIRMKLKKVLKVILIAVAVIAACFFLLIGIAVYGLYYAVSTVDESESPGGTYTLQLQSVGSPIFFSSAKGRLVLKEGKKKIVACKFVLYDDGGSVRPDIWQADWKEEYVEIIISGDEQDDEQIRIWYSGKTQSEYIGKDSGSNLVKGSYAEDFLSEYQIQKDSERRLRQLRITEGYRAVYDSFFEINGYDFTEASDAKGNSRVILHEDEAGVEYLVYDRESANGKCGLYVYYRSEKAEDGSWSPSEASLLDIYAYVYDSGEVVSSGKTDWADKGSQAYCEATGES